ncbi:MAG: CHAT domain-containing protein [Cyanobacteria bacterium P01_E01_bin.6]
MGNGEEVLGFGYQIQRTGARAAIASLWSVDDGGTQALMTTFYRTLQRQDVPPKAEALRQSQIALINGSITQFDRGTAGHSIPSQSYEHPYYWAPFILIGNGL